LYYLPKLHFQLETQTEKFVVVTIPIKGLAKEAVKADFQERHLSVTIQLHTGADYE
jgi:hypothetical protein